MRRRLAFAAALALALAHGRIAAAQVPGLSCGEPPPERAPSFEGWDARAGWDGASGFEINPALAGLRYPHDLSVAYTDFDGDANAWRAALNAHGLAFGAAHVRDGPTSAGAGLAFGAPRFRAGWALRWTSAAGGGERTADLRIGVLSRPAAWASFGATAEHLTQPRLLGIRAAREYGAGVALRPLALVPSRAHDLGPRFTVSADAVLEERANLDAARSRFGAELELIPGLALRGSVDRDGWNLGFACFGPRSSARWHAAFTPDGVLANHTYGVSIHDAEDRTAFASRAERRVATLRLGGHLADETIADNSWLGGGSTVSVAPVRRGLERALEDPLTRGVLLELGYVTNMAQIEELKPYVARLRAAGKPVVAYIEYGGGRGALDLAAGCDRSFASGDAWFSGLGLRSERRYYRGLLDSLGVKLERSSIGEYKSAYRNYSVDSTNAYDRESLEQQLDRIQELFVTSFLASRPIPRENLLAAIDGRAWGAAGLVNLGVLDSLGYREDALAALGRLCGLGAKPRTAPLRALAPAAREWARPTGLAIVYASGAIDVGRSGGDLLNGPYMGSETVTRQLEAAFRRRDVKAVVLRVESPGGSTNASDLIHHATARLQRETKKPLVVSMGGVAASGGYYIACGAKRIFADRATRTGSIGVVFVKPSFEGWYRKRGVRQDVFERGAWMGGESYNADWTPAMQAIADSAIARTYERFLARVAAGRGLTHDAADAVARGRVWMGDDAKAKGLVDAIGGLDEAIAEARSLARIPAGLKLAPAEYRRPRGSLLERVIGTAIRDAVDRAFGAREFAGPEYRAEPELLDE